MKKRLISVFFALILLGAVLYLVDTLALNVILALAGSLAIFESLRAFKMNDNVVLLIVLLMLHAANMFFDINAHYFVFLIILILFVFIMADKNRHYSFKQAAALGMMVFLVTLGLRSMLNLRYSGVAGDAAAHVGDMRFMLLVALALGWICDTLAFTFGKLFGKRKMCPEISPNKTIAGGVGGVAGTPVVITLAFYLYSVLGSPLSAFYEMNEPVHLVFYFVMGLLGAVIGIIGDLAASFVKRECGIKDFGSIMPGHGGAIDRLDSVLFTATFAAFAFELFFKLFLVLPAALLSS